MQESQGMKLIVEINEDLHMKLKLKAVKEKTTIKELVTKVLEEKYG